MKNPGTQALQAAMDNAIVLPPRPSAPADKEELDSHRNAPHPDPACLYGLVGDIARIGSENTEANPYAVAAAAITYLSCAVGRGPFMRVGNNWHHANQYALHVGRSNVGRKGTALGIIRRIDRKLRDISLDSHGESPFQPQLHDGGLSSREGLAMLIHDAYREGQEEVPAIEDKRLLVVEEEFANILQQGKRDGNTLSAALRTCWDGHAIKPATKTNRVWASYPHVAVLSAITPSELKALIAQRDLSNGFLNRFMLYWAERPRLVPFPRGASNEAVQELAERVLDVLQYCNADQYVHRDVLEVTLSPEACTIYEEAYRGELNDRSGGERVTAIMERRPTIALRLAMLFALTDKAAIAGPQHIEAALAWARYSAESVRFIFSSAAEEAETAEANDAADRILEFLQLRMKVTRTDITKDCFKGHTTKTVIDAALDELLRTNPPRVQVTEELVRGVRKTKFYELCT